MESSTRLLKYTNMCKRKTCVQFLEGFRSMVLGIFMFIINAYTWFDAAGWIRLYIYFFLRLLSWNQVYDIYGNNVLDARESSPNPIHHVTTRNVKQIENVLKPVPTFGVLKSVQICVRPTLGSPPPPFRNKKTEKRSKSTIIPLQVPLTNPIKYGWIKKKNLLIKSILGVWTAFEVVYFRVSRFSRYYYNYCAWLRAPVNRRVSSSRSNTRSTAKRVRCGKPGKRPCLCLIIIVIREPCA